MSATSHLGLAPIRAGGDTGIPKHEDPRPEVQYDGPSMKWLIQNRKLAHQIIATHHLAPGGNILDNTQLVFLREYVEDPSPTGVREWARERGVWDDGGDRFDQQKLAEKGSLVGHAISLGAFDEESLSLLKEWYGSGVLDKELKGVE